METYYLFIELDESRSTCLGHLCFPRVGESQSGRRKDSGCVFPEAHQPGPLITLLRLLVLPGPSGIEHLLIVWGLNLYPLRIKAQVPSGWSAIAILWKQKWFLAFAVCTGQRWVTSSLLPPHPFLSILPPEILKLLHTFVWWKSMMLNGFSNIWYSM